MTKYEEYHKIKQQISVLQDKQKVLAEEILEEIKDLSVPMKFDFGTFSKVTTTKYRFGKDIQKREEMAKAEIARHKSSIEEALQKIKDDAVRAGKFELEVTTTLRFTEKP